MFILHQSCCLLTGKAPTDVYFNTVCFSIVDFNTVYVVYFRVDQNTILCRSWSPSGHGCGRRAGSPLASGGGMVCGGMFASAMFLSEVSVRVIFTFTFCM